MPPASNRLGRILALAFCSTSEKGFYRQERCHKADPPYTSLLRRRDREGAEKGENSTIEYLVILYIDQWSGIVPQANHRSVRLEFDFHIWRQSLLLTGPPQELVCQLKTWLKIELNLIQLIYQHAEETAAQS